MKTISTNYKRRIFILIMMVSEKSLKTYDLWRSSKAASQASETRTCDAEGDAPVVVRECVAQLGDVGGNCRDTM